MIADARQEDIRARLRERKAELTRRASRVRADLTRENEPLSADFAEQVTQRENDDVLGAIGMSAQSEIVQIDRALARLERGEYETCAVCGEPIEAQRLAAVPYAIECRRCAEARTHAG
jgi:RNA polymerase-binding transcription factor DksA